jgi:hypothetical protein
LLDEKLLGCVFHGRGKGEGVGFEHVGRMWWLGDFMGYLTWQIFGRIRSGHIRCTSQLC